MSNIVKFETKNEVAIIDDVDPFLAYADAVAPTFIIGKLLRFSKGDYLTGDGAEAIAEGTTFTVNLDELAVGWVKWQNSKPTEHRMVRVADGKVPSPRDGLGDTDSACWEKDSDGEPRDPWQLSNYLPLLDESGQLFTFTTSSRGGLSAIADLARRYGRHRKNNPDVYPRIELNVGSYAHPNKAYGRVKFPDFKPAGWVPKTEFHAAMEAAGYISGATEQTASEASEELSDSIPF